MEIFCIEYLYSFIGFIYRDPLKLLEKNYDSPLLKQVWIIFSTIVISCGILIFINKTFSKRSKYIKPYNLYKNTNKHYCVTYVKQFFICLLVLLLLQKCNMMKINFEVLKEQESRDIFNTDSYLMMKAIEKSETTNFLSYYALSKAHLHKHKSYFRYILLLSGDINLNPGPNADALPFSNESFSNDESQIFSGSDDRNLNFEKWAALKKKGLHFVHININSLLPKIDELQYLTKLSNASIVGIGEIKLDDSNSSTEIEIEGYDLLRLDRSRRGGGVACYIKKSLAYNCKEKFFKTTESIFIDIFLPKVKPILAGILYRPADKNDFVINLEETFTGCGTLANQECYLLGGFNINLLHNGKNIFGKKEYTSKLKSLPSLTKEYLDFGYSFCLQKLISVSSRIKESTATLIDHVLTNSPHKIIQSGVIEMSLSDQELIYCTRKTTKLRSNKHHELNIPTMKNYTAENFIELLNKIDFSNY